MTQSTVLTQPIHQDRLDHVQTPDGRTVSYLKYGTGPSLVLVHGGFSDHLTNWQEARPFLAERFTVYAMARRGRGETTLTQGHSVADEASDVVAVLRRIGEPVFLLGHSYGAACSLEAATLAPDCVSKLVLYEHPSQDMVTPSQSAQLDELANHEDWDTLVQIFMRDVLLVPDSEVQEIRSSRFWDAWIVDAPISMNDVRAIARHNLEPNRYRSLNMPVQLLVGSESPPDLWATKFLANVLPDVRIDSLEGQAHEGMTTAPELFTDTISKFLLRA
jgi:pimeloyl-ACP methyl ester carboxylesterase